jgi:hypothetical protein
MAFASAVMMLAASPQIFLSLASTQDSFLPIVDVLTVYGRHASSEVRQMLAPLFFNFITGHEDRLATSRPPDCRQIGSEYLRGAV